MSSTPDQPETGTQATLEEATSLERQRRAAIQRDAPDRNEPATREHPPADEPGELEYPPEACQNCGSHLSETFRRGYGDNQDIVWNCIHCPEAKKNGIEGTAGHVGRDTL